MHTKVSLEVSNLNSGKPFSTTEDNSEPNQQERLKKLVQNENYKFWLGGFIEGEGSLVVSIVKNNKLTHGLALQPEFNVVQHVNGIDILNSFKVLFNNKGSVHKKSGSEDVWVYSIKGVQNLHDYVLPYFEKYVAVYSSKYKTEIFQTFCLIITSLYNNKNKALSKEEMIKLIKLVYSNNPEGKGKERKRTLHETLDLINQK